MKRLYGVDAMPETGENVAQEYNVTRQEQDQFALRSQEKAAAAQASGRLGQEIVPVCVGRRRVDPIVCDKDEHPRLTTLEMLRGLKPVVRPDGTVTAGNASGVNDGAASSILRS